MFGCPLHHLFKQLRKFFKGNVIDAERFFPFGRIDSSEIACLLLLLPEGQLFGSLFKAAIVNQVMNDFKMGIFDSFFKV